MKILKKKKGIVKIMIKESGSNQLWLRENIGRGGKTKEEPYHIAYAMRVADRMIGILSGIEVHITRSDALISEQGK